MNIYDELEKNLKESFASTIQEKLIYCQGYLEGDPETEDLYNFIGYLLWSSNSVCLNPPIIPSSFLPNFTSEVKKND